MNKIVSQIILGFIFITFLVILSFYTFFAGEKKELNSPDFNISKIGNQKLDGLISDKINFSTTIYSINKDYKISDNIISFGTGIYLIDSRDVFSTVTLEMGTNKVLLKGGGMVYIDNNSEYKIISSFNNKVKIDFLNTLNNKKGVEIYLYPHMYLGFRPTRFNKKEEADSLRVSQLGSLKYFNGNLLDILKGGKINFIKEENRIFLEKSVKDILDKQKKYSDKLNDFKDNNFLNIDGSDYIEKYFSIFYNDRKKTVYFKNKTLKLLTELLNKNNKDNSNINEILSNLESIKELNILEYNEMKSFIKEIFYLISFDLSDESDFIQNNYDLLISKIFKINDTRKIKLIKNVDRYNYLGDFTKYLNLSVLNIENKDLTLLDKEYYILFKQNILVSNFSNLDIETKYYEILLKGFISYSQNIEKNITIEEKDKFLVNTIYNLNLLEKISKSLRYRYFEDERNNQELLIFKDEKNIQNIKEINDSIEELFKKYNKSEKYFKENLLKYNSYIKKYKIIKIQLKEYIDALENYSLYKKQYSKVNRVLSGVEVYEDEEEKLSEGGFIEYITNFSGIELSSLDFDIEEYLYKVNNISINGRNFSFDLLPYSGNTIQNIDYKNNGSYNNSREKQKYNFLESTSYSLDGEKEKYKELFSKAKNEEKEKYNFKNFFINTFFVSDIEKKEDFEGNNYEQNDDDQIIQTFKIAKLLGNKGEFRNILNILDVKYSNLDVERKSGENFSIKIVESELNIDIENGNRDIKYSAIFDSDYKIDNNKHYFYNIRLKPSIKKTSSNNEIIFDNIDLKISGKINISDFEKNIKKIFTDIPKIKAEYLLKKEEAELTQITYSIITGKYYIK